MTARLREKAGFSTADAFQGLLGTTPQIIDDEQAETAPPEKDHCKICGNTRFIAPKMVVLTAPCCHRLCDSCVQRIYSHGGNAPCPQCQQIFRKKDWVGQSFDNLLVERECRIRKQLGRIYNKRPEDFASLNLYNDYLEEVESIFYDAMYNIDPDKLLARIEAYRQENQDSISRNLARQSHEDRVTATKLESEKKAYSNSLLHRKFVIDDEKIDTKHESMMLDEYEYEATQGEKEESDEKRTDNYAYAMHYEKRSRFDDSQPETVDAEISYDKQEVVRTRFGGIHPEKTSYPHIDLMDEYPYDLKQVKDSELAYAGGYLPKFGHLRALENCFSALFLNSAL